MDMSYWRQLTYLDMRRNLVTEIPESLCQNWPLVRFIQAMHIQGLYSFIYCSIVFVEDGKDVLWH